MREKRYYKKSSLQHMSISVEGVLKQFKNKKITFCNNDDGTQMSDAKARQIFMQARFEGQKVLPMGDECYRFDYQTGCKGHITSLMPTDEMMDKINNEMLTISNNK